MSQLYHKTPSELVGIEDEYTGFCLNEACAYIQAKIENGEDPVFRLHYHSFSDLYSQYTKG